MVILAYYPQANEIIEHNYKPIIVTFLKILDRGSTNWLQNLPAVLWVDQSSISMLTGLTPYYICYKNEPIFFIKLEVLT